MSNLDNTVFNNEIANTPVGVPPDQFTFETISDLEIPADLEAFDEAVDPQYQAMLNSASDEINKTIASPIANMNNLPGAAGGRYNPAAQQEIPSPDTMEGKIRLFQNINKRTPQISKTDNIFGDNTVNIKDPIYSGIAATQFDRYYAHPAFSRLGFRPYRNNEEFYNSHSSGWEDAQRMFGQLNKLMGTGYLSSYRSWFEDDVMDLKSAIEYEDAVRIGSSSRGGFGGGLNNFVLNSGYTLGIIGSIAVEELAMWGATVALGLATPVTGGASGAAAVATGAAAAARTAYNAGRLAKAFRSIGQSFKIGKAFQATRTMVKSFKNIDKVRDLHSAVRGTGNVLGKILAPETVKAFKSLNSAKKAGQNLTNMAQVSKTVGGLYRDMRSMNFALSEGRMEGGSVYKEQWEKEFIIALDKNREDGLGDNLSYEQLQGVNERAKAAALTTTMFNAPVIYLSNQLLLGNAFGGYKRSINQIAREGIEGAASRVIRGKAATKVIKDTVKKQAGKEAGKQGKKQVQKQLYESVEDGFMNWRSTLKKVKSAGLRGGATMAGAAALRFTANNLSEGIQEVYQEAVAEGIKDYYTNLAFDPLAGGTDMFNASLSHGIKSQMSAQGLHTFASGFFMSTLVGGPQKLIFQTMPELYQATFNKEQYQAYKAQKEAEVTRIVDSMNEYGDALAQDPTNLFGLEKMQYATQKQAAEAMEEAQANDDLMGFIDMKDHAKFHNMFTLFETGKTDFFKEQLEDYLSLTDQELAEAFPDRKADAKSGKLRNSIQNQITKLDKMEQWFAQNKDKIQVTAKPENFEKGSREHQDEQIKFLAQRHAKYLYLFTKDGFERAAERTDAIYEKLATDPIIKDLAANDLTVFLTKDALLTEIAQLRGEVEVLGDPGSKQAKKRKEKKLAHLEKIADVLYNEEYLADNGSFDRRRIGKLMPLIGAYLDDVAKTRNGFVDNEMLLDTVKSIIDHNHLSVRQAKYDKALRVMTDPAYLDDLLTAGKLYFKFAYENRKALFREAIEKFINKQEINQLLNTLADLGVYPDMDSTILFSQTGDPKDLGSFYNAEGIVNNVDDPELYEKIENAIDIYRQTATDALKKAAEKAKKEAEEEAKGRTAERASSSVDQMLAEEGVDAPESKIIGKTKEESPVLDQTLQRLFSEMKALGLKQGFTINPSWEKFLESDLAKEHITAYNGLKKLWYQTLTSLPEEERMDRFNRDIGFIDWLKLQGTNDLVQKVLAESAIGVGAIRIQAFIPEVEAEIRSDEKREVDSKTSDSINIQTRLIFDHSTGEQTTIFILTDKNNNLIDEEIYTSVGIDPIRANAGFRTRKEANDAIKLMANLVPVTASFTFDGQTLTYADVVEDINTKKKYVIISDANTVDRYGNLLLMKMEDIGKLNPKQAIAKAVKSKELNLSEGDFQKRFATEQLNAGIASLPANVTKLNVREATRLIPHRTNFDTNFPENEELARRRYDFIIKNLTPEQLKQLKVKVRVRPDGGKDIGYVKFGDKAANPFIKKTRAPYDIEIIVPDEILSPILKKLPKEIKKPEGNALGYIPNGNVVLLDRTNGTVINPLSITADQVKDLFDITGSSKEQAAEDIKQNFAIQFTIMNSIAEKLGDSAEMEMSLEDIGGVDFFSTPGAMLFDGIDKPVNDLNIKTVDGVTIILENTKLKNGKVATRLIHNGERGEGPTLQRKIKNEMDAQNPNLYEGATGTSRYTMVVKSASGVYSYFPVKTPPLSDESLQTIADTLIKRSVETAKENFTLEGKGKTKKKKLKNLQYNSTFNADLNSNESEDIPTFYIAGKPGYTFELAVTANGSVSIKVYDRKLKQSQYVGLSAEDVATYAESENKADFIKALVTNYNDYLSNLDPEKADTKKKAFFTNLKKNGALKENALKESFEELAPAEEISDAVTTQVGPSVRKKSALVANISGVDSQNIKSTPIISRTTSGVFTPSERFTDAQGKPIPKGPAMTTSTESLNIAGEIGSLEELSDDEFTELQSKDFLTLTKDQQEYLAKRVATLKQEELTDRELTVLSSPASSLINVRAQAYKTNEGQPKSNATSANTIENQKKEVSLEKQLEDLKSQLDARMNQVKENNSDLFGLALIKAIQQDSTVKSLEKKIQEVRLKQGGANKISDDLSLDDVRHIDEFAAWAASNLPEFITLDNIATLTDNMKSGGERVGAFVMSLEKIAGKEKIGGKLYVGATSKYAYHEAFHSVFRLLLTKEQQEQYYKLAKKEVLAKLRGEGKSLKEEIEGLRNTDIAKYKDYSNDRMEKEYLEEYMADEFEVFKQSPRKTKTDSWIKSLFNKILEWIRNVLGNFNGPQLNLLYKDISSGKYRQAEVVSNPFTDDLFSGATIDASKLIRYKKEVLENGKELYKNLPNKQSVGIISSIAARVVDLEMKNESADFDIKDAVKKSIELYKELYNPDNAQYRNLSIQQLLDVGNIYEAFTNYDKDILESVVDTLAIYDIKLEVIEELDEENEVEYGLRTTEQYGKDASQIGGARSLSSFLRKYIASTTLSEKDEFGNEYLSNGERLIVPVDFSVAYSGFLKAAAGTTDPVRILQKLYIFSQNNPQTRAIVERLYGDLNLVWEDQLEDGIIPAETSNNLLFQSMLKGFENFKIDYLFLHTNTKDGSVVGYSAANRDDAHTQIERWETEYKHRRRLYLADPKLKEEASDELARLLEFINTDQPINKMTNVKLAEVSKNVSEALAKTMGIKLHADYIAYTIANNITKPTKYQSALLESQKDVILIDPEAIMYMKQQFDGDADLMSQAEDEGVYNRLRRLGLGNAMFDETVGASVFKNANGDLVYSHQLPTMHLKKMAELNDIVSDPTKVAELIENEPYVATNYLLNDPAFRQMAKEGLLKITRISGSKSSKGIEVDSDGGVIEGYDRNEKGTVYGDYDPKQFLASLLSAYISGVNPKSGKLQAGVIPEGQDDMVALAPVLLRVIEASNTGDLSALPIIKAVEENAKGETQITDQALDAYVKNITAEFDRIQRELNPYTKTEKLKAGYNADKKGQKSDLNGRAYRFANNKLILTPSNSITPDVESGKLLDSSSTITRIREGNQKLFIKTDAAAVAMGFFAEGESTNLEIGIGEETKVGKGKRRVFKQAAKDKSTFHRVKLIGKKSVNNLTLFNVEDMLGEAISDKKTDTHTKEVEIGNQTRWVESDAMKAFLLGEKEFFVYEVIENDLTNLTEEELDILEKEAVDQEDYAKAKEIADLRSYGEINYASELERILKEHAKEQEGKSEEDYETLTLEEALSKIPSDRDINLDSLKAFITERIDQEFKQFNKDINNEFYRVEEDGSVYLDLPRFISTGLKRNENSTGSEAAFENANQKLNLTNNRTHNLKQIFINDWINTTAINDLLLGDQAVSLKDGVDAVKRAKMQNAAYYSAASRISSKKHNVLNPLQKISMFAVTDPIASSIHTKEDIEQADAQNWMTIKAFRYMWFGFGKLTETQSKLLDKIEAGAEISVEEIFGAAGAVKKQEMLNSKKLVYGDGKVFDKFSVIPLSKAMTSMKDKNGNWIAKPGREILHNMRVKMEQYEQDQLDQGIDTVAMVAPLSALKMMKENVSLIDDLVNPNETIIQSQGKGTDAQYMGRSLSYEAVKSGKPNRLTTDNVMDLDANFMGLQVLNPSNKEEIIDPTQIKTLLTGEQDDKATVRIDGEVVSIGALRKRYNELVSARLTQKYIDKRNLVFDIDPEYAMDQLHKSIEAKKITPDLYSFLNYAQTSLLASQSSSQLLEFFSFDEDGNPTFDFVQDSPMVEAKFKQLFLSYFSKGVMAEKIPGTGAALLSDYGFSQYRKVYSVDENNYIDRQEIIRTNDFAQNYSMSDVQMEGNDVLDLSNDDKFDVLAQRVNKLKKGEFIIVKDRLRPNMKEYNIKGEYTGVKYSESLMPAHSKEVYENLDLLKPDAAIPDSVGKMFGIRIPSQDNHSTINVKVVDFLPVFNGSTIVASRELVEVSGADFDIDKLYLQMKEYYLKDGEFFEYKNNFEDYVRYINKKVKKKGSTYAEAAMKAKKRKGKLLSDAKFKAAKERGFDVQAIHALRILNLPLSKPEYNKYVETTGRAPFAAGYNNEILDTKFRLMGHDGVTTSADGSTPISYEAADLLPLTNPKDRTGVWEMIQTEMPELAETLSEENLDINNLRGKGISFGNNKEGAKSIGAAVLPNLYLSLMQEVDIRLAKGRGFELNLGGQVYDGFYNYDPISKQSRTRELLEDGSEGFRKQYIISALITAMTDNAKERLAKKLGLSQNGLGIVTAMTGMGVPIKTSIGMMNHPTIRRAYELEKRAPEFEFDVKEHIEEKITSLKLAGNQYELFEDDVSVGVNQDNLIKAVNEPMLSFRNDGELEQKLDNLEEFELEDIGNKMLLDIAILEEFLKAYDIASFLRPVGDLLNLSKGFGVDTASIAKVKKARQNLKLDLTDQEMANLPPNEVPMFDLRKVFSSDRWQTTMLDIYDEFVDSLLPKVFLNESKPFNNIFTSFQDNFKYLNKEDRAMVEKDLLSYITISGYMHWLGQNKSSVLGMPTNKLIYPEEGQTDIVDVYEKLKTVNGEKYNYFLDGFVRPERATDPGNKTGISMLTSNTLTTLNDSQKIDVQNGFKELFVDPATRYGAMQVLNYMIVKDGLQPLYRSIMNAVDPEMFAEYLGTLPNTSNVFATMSEAQMQSNFGMSFKELKLNFLKEYGLHPKTARLLKSGWAPKELVLNSKAFFTQSFGEFKKSTVENNPDKLFVIFDNQAGIGSSNNKEVRDYPNVISINIKKNAGSAETDFYNKEEESAAIQHMEAMMAYLEQAAEGYDSVVIQDRIAEEELKGILKYTPNFHENLLSKLDKLVGYKPKGLTDKDKKSERKAVNIAAKKKSVFINNTVSGRAVLTVDIEKGLSGSVNPSFKNTDDLFAERKLADPKKKGFEFTTRSQQIATAKTIFQIDSIPEGKYVQYVATFPQTIRVNVEGEGNKYFQLVRYAGPAYGEIGPGMSRGTALGTYAQYVEVDIMGSSAQTPIGFIFGERQTNDKIKEIVSIANEPQIEEGGEIDNESYEYGTIEVIDRKMEDLYNKTLETMRRQAEEGGGLITKAVVEQTEKAGIQAWINMSLSGIPSKEVVAVINEFNNGDSADVSYDSETKTVKIDTENMTKSGSFKFDTGESTTEENIDLSKIDTSNMKKTSFNLGETSDTQGIPEDVAEEKVEEFWDSLAIPQKTKLKELYKINNLEDLIKESKKSYYQNIDQFIEEINSCFK